MEEVRIGVVGIGNMGSAHSANIFAGKVKGLRLCGICDNDPAKLAWASENLPGVPQYSDYEELLSSGTIDAVIVAVPHPLHPVVDTAAFAHGLHVLSEKPEGIDVETVTKLNETAKASGKTFAIMFNQRTNPLFGKLREMIANGEFGELKRLVWIVTNWYRTQSYYDSGSWRATWNGEGGGVLLNQCPHNLDIWQWITGMPSKVRAFCQVGHFHNIHVEDDVTIYAQYANGASASFITSTGEYPGTNRLEITGSKCKAIAENGVLKLWKLGEDEREICFNEPMNTSHAPVDYIEWLPDREETAHLGILQNFANHLLFGEELISPGYDGIFELSISNAAYLSDWTGRTIDLPLSVEDQKEFNRLLKERQDNEETLEKTLTDGEKPAGTYSDRWSVRW